MHDRQKRASMRPTPIRNERSNDDNQSQPPTVYTRLCVCVCPESPVVYFMHFLRVNGAAAAALKIPRGHPRAMTIRPRASDVRERDACNKCCRQCAGWFLRGRRVVVWFGYGWLRRNDSTQMDLDFLVYLLWPFHT